MNFDSLLQIFKEIDNNLKNDMINDRIKIYNQNFKYDKFVDTIKKYINNFLVLRETDEDELLSMIDEKANNILNYTKDEHFNVHHFTNDAIYLMDKTPNPSKQKKKSSHYLEEIFYQYLLDKGYPEDKVFKEVAISRKSEYRIIPDIKIIGKNNKQIAYVEIKSTQSRLKLQEIINKIKKIQVDNVLFFIAIFIHDEEEFIYARVNDNNIVYLDDFPRYEDLTFSIESSKKNPVIPQDSFVSNIDFEELMQLQKKIKDLDYGEEEYIKVLLKKFGQYLQEQIPKLKSYNWKLEQVSSPLQQSYDNGFRLSFYRENGLPNSAQINVIFGDSWYVTVFMNDNEKLIFRKSDLVESLQKKYPNIEFVKTDEHIKGIHIKNRIYTEDEVISSVKNVVEILETIKTLNDRSIKSERGVAIPPDISIKKKSEMKSALGVEAVANTLSSIIVKGFDDTGMMIGIFGKWGRGKTHFLEKLWDSIKEKKINYRHVLFSAWKYQDTKASWAYLYENIFNAYLDDVKNERTWIRKLKKCFKHKSWYKIANKVDNFYIEKKKIFNINIQKHSWTPIIILILLFIIAAIWSFWIDKWEILHYIISTVGIVLAIKLIIFYFAQKSSAIDLGLVNFRGYLFEDSLIV